MADLKTWKKVEGLRKLLWGYIGSIKRRVRVLTSIRRVCMGCAERVLLLRIRRLHVGVLISTKKKGKSLKSRAQINQSQYVIKLGSGPYESKER